MTIRQPIVTVAGHVDHGKCVATDTLIPLVDGTIITAKELFEQNFDVKKAKKIEDGVVQELSNKDVTVFSFNGKEIVNKRISHIWKRKANKLIEIKTASGDAVKTTPEHPFFVFNLKGLDEKKAEDLQKGDYIAIPKKINLNDTLAEETLIKKLKSSKNFVCFLNPNSDALIEKIKKQKIRNVERSLKIKNLGDSLTKKRFRVRDFFFLTNYFKIPDKEAYFMIESLKNSNEGWRVGHTSRAISLPNLNELEKFGYILGCLAGDGYISRMAILNNNDFEVQEAYRTSLKVVFNIDSETKQGHTCKIVTDNGGLTFSRFLIDLIGFPKKNKSAEISVPEIVKKNKQMFKGFFSGLFDTDGYASRINNSIEITSKSKRLINECSVLLLNFRIHSVVYEKKGFWVLRIANKIYLDTFLENFNPRLKRKLERVINALTKAETSRIFDFIPVSGKILTELKVPGKINKKIPYFTKYKGVNKLPAWLLKQTLENLKKENEVSKKFRELLERELSYIEIVSKREIENKDMYVYDFTVPDTHNFVAERILVHNTSILDCIRGSSIAKEEAGGITQKISFTLFPAEKIKDSCPLIKEKKIKLEIPGFLFIDTPGHAAFTNLRKRGGSLADLAVLVIDIKEGIKPQTAEVISILKQNKTPFVVALNKIDKISGWQNLGGIKESIEAQATNVKQEFDNSLYEIIGSLHAHGFEAELYYNVSDFTKKLALVPCSARTRQGISELILVLCGLSQKFLKQRLNLGKDARGVILEIKKEKTMSYAESILYDGILSIKDEIAIATFEKPIITKIRVLEEILPLSKNFKRKQEARAATGIRIQIAEQQDVLPGMPFVVFKNNTAEIEREFKKELSETVKLNKEGIIVKADSLGSLEALLFMLRQQNIKILKAEIGSINKNDVVTAIANLEKPIDAVVLGFNVSIDEEIKELDTSKIKILRDDVIYKLIENLQKFREEKTKEIEKEKLLGLATICKLKIMHECVFRNSKPAIFGVAVQGKIKHGISLFDEQAEKIGRIKAIQSEGKTLQEAKSGQEVAISLPGVTFDRQLKNSQFLYSDLSESQFREFKKNKDLLSGEEISILQEIAKLKRQKRAGWGV